MVAMLLELAELKLRSWRKSDLDALLRHANNPNIAANLRDQFPHPYTRRSGIEYLEFVRDQKPERAFALEYGGEAIGGLGFQIGLDIARVSAEMGYWVSENYWGQGFATQAATAASEWAFDAYKLTRIFALAFTTNVASIRVLEKAGFEREGLLRRSAIKNGVVLDQVLYAKVR
jgi:[ribosomal protein S5]-alanine N-acetyltransferase